MGSTKISAVVSILLGVVILIWPGLALWIVAVILGGGLILSGIVGGYQNPHIVGEPC